MKTRGKKAAAIDDYHKMEIAEIFTQMREHLSQRVQIYSFFATAHLVTLGLALTNQKVSLMILAISLPIILIIIDHSLKRSLASIELRGLQLEEMYAPDPELATLHMSIAVSHLRSKQILDLQAINDLQDVRERILALRRIRPGLTGSLGLPVLVILEIGMVLSFWFSGWKIF